MALRIKSQWFRGGAPRSAEQSASVVAFIVWRVTQNMLKQLRAAGFDIDVGPRYFAFMREVLVFLALVVDRWVFARMDEAARADFTSALVQRLGGILEESEAEWLGEPTQSAASWSHQFIDQCNQLSQEYAAFRHDADGPDFAFVRFFASRVEALMPPKDQRWVTDQLMAIEVPEALEMVQRGLDGALSTAERPRRRAAVSGD